MRWLISILFFVLIFSCTKNQTPPTGFGTKINVTTSAVFNLASQSVSSGGTVSSVSGLFVTERGICWGTSINPTTAINRKIAGSGEGTFTASITGLTPNKTYCLRAYAINSVGTFYGNNISFVTLAALPTVSTSSITSIKDISASGGGSVISDGGLTVSARGVVWSTGQNPTIALSTKTVNGTGIGSFSSTISGLIPATTYYVRAYATNSAGTAYGTQQTFTTSTAVTLASISTSTISSVTQNTAISGGNITSDGGAAVTSRGVCWNTTGSPTISNSRTSNGSGTGAFTSSISGLSPRTTYYVRAYATNSAGTSYGVQRTFTTQ